MSKTIQHASPKQIIEVGDRLRDVFDVEAGRYRGDHSDLSVAQAAGVSKNSVRNVRQSLGMEIRRLPPQNVKLELIAELEKRVVVIEERLSQQALQLARLDHVVAKIGETVSKEKLQLAIASARIAFPSANPGRLS